jgi:hypothetical protein
LSCLWQVDIQHSPLYIVVVVVTRSRGSQGVRLERLIFLRLINGSEVSKQIEKYYKGCLDKE